MSTDSFEFEVEVMAPKEQVYWALTHQSALPQWLCDDARTDVKEGGRIYLYWQNDFEMTGRFTKIQENESIAYSWQGRGEPAESRVKMQLLGSNGHTKLKLTHDGIGSEDSWERIRQEIKTGWTDSLANLKMLLEEGVDKRIHDRPFMGIVPGSLISEKESQDLDVAGGIRLATVLAGSSAASAGLKDEDILVEMAQAQMSSFPALGEVLSGSKVGDQIHIVYYRNNERQEVEMTLGARPIPPLPESPGEIADQLEKTYAELDRELDNVFDGVSTADAFQAPEPGEWSAAQVLGHLMVTERGIQMGIYTRIGGQPMSVFPSNDTEIINSVLAVYPSIDEILSAWKRTEAETVALIRQLPQSFIDRKADYQTVGMNLLIGLPGHTRGHIGQIKNALAAARQVKLA